MYSMAAFGPVLGFLLGAYLLSFHMDSLSSNIVNIGEKCVSMKETTYLCCFVNLTFIYFETIYLFILIFSQILRTDDGLECGGVDSCYAGFFL